MKTAIKLVLIDLLIAQIVAPILIMIPCTIYLFVTTGNLDKVTLTQMIMIPAQLAGQIMMGIYLWKAGYISKKRATWLPVSASYLVCSAIAILTCGFAVSSLMSLLDWIPNIMEQSFNILQSGWGGILAIAIVGPVLEELLFRGAITHALLQQYNPTKSNSDFRTSVRCLSYKSRPDPSGISDRYPVGMDLLQNRQSDTLYTHACTKQLIVSLS